MKRLRGRLRRKKRIRRHIIGTSRRPRLSIYRSHKNFYVQLVDDIKGHTVLSLSTASPKLKGVFKYGGNVKAASALGEELAKKAKAGGITKIVFDRSGYIYHGRIKALAEAVRKGGFTF